MDWPTHCAAIVPCLNEQAAIGPLVMAIRQHLPEVIVVDDGSTDATARIAAEAGATVLRHAKPGGKGAALHTGWKHACESGFDWAITLDGDGQHSPHDISAFLQCAEMTSASLVVGNRMLSPRGMPFIRRMVNRWMSTQLSGLAGCPLPDSQCGFRLMKLAAWEDLPISVSHFEIESEVLLEFARAGHRIEFVPIRVIYKAEQSKISPWRDTVRWFRWRRRAKNILLAPPGESKRLVAIR